MHIITRHACCYRTQYVQPPITWVYMLDIHIETLQMMFYGMTHLDMQGCVQAQEEVVVHDQALGAVDGEHGHRNEQSPPCMK